MILAILLLVLLPKIDRWSGIQSQKFKSIHQFFYWSFITDIILLGFCGMKPLVEPYIWLSQVCTFFYFFLYFCLFFIIPGIEVYLAKRILDKKNVKKWWYK
jgi:ubiquinol-cytochrome c reductase cytochrome b subunit